MTTFDRLREYQDHLVEKGIAGNDIAVFLDGTPVYRYMTGYRDVERKEKIDRETVYRMFSMTKPLTVVAAMQLYEQGRFMLYDPLYLYLPEFREMTVREKLSDGSERMVPAKTPIRILDLFQMTAGFDYDSKAPEFLELYDATANRFTLRDFVKVLAKRPLLFEPGTHWFYSFAHDVLASLVEAVSGLPFGQYLKKNLFEPLGMKSATHHPSEAALNNECVLHSADENGVFHCIRDGITLYNLPNYEGGGSGIYMSVDDYAKFACTLTNLGVSKDGYRLLSSSAVDLIRENHLNGELLREFQRSKPNRAGYGYGLGMRTLISRADSNSLSSLGEFGWSGYCGTYVLMDPATGVTVVLGDQVLPDKPRSVHTEVRNMVYAALEYEGLI